MNRFGKYTSGAAEDARVLAMGMKCTGMHRLVLDGCIAIKLRQNMRRAAAMHAECEALRRLKAEEAQILSALRDAREQADVRLPAEGRHVRLLQLARLLVAGGEECLQAGDIVAAACAFNGVQDMNMREIQCLSDALKIALCEALAQLSGEMIDVCRQQKRAGEWLHAGGKKLLPRRMGAAFCAYGLKLSSEMEEPDKHARILRSIDRSGRRAELLVEQAHAQAADHCLRMDNLMHLMHLLKGIDWEECFMRVSPADQELREEESQVYARMDDSSRACVREEVARLARSLDVSELTVVRYALREVRNAVEEYGRQDPRSNVCWYLMEDAGRKQLCAALGKECRLRTVPDPDGRKTVWLVGVSAALTAALLAWAFGRWILAPYALPLAWVLSMQVIGRIYPRHIKPRRILKMQIDRVPECGRTLVVLPVLLSSAERTGEMIARMEALGCMEQDENIDFLLLGDFRDADGDVLPEDTDILERAREGVAKLNMNGRRKYYYLHRCRSYRQADARWMGKNRKRGALTALNNLLLERPGAQEAFCAEGSDAAVLAGRYKYVVTLDADTEYLPGTLQKLIGAMLHPLNRACAPCGHRRGYAVLQPSMLMMAESCTNAYVQRRFGEGGVDGYPVTLSDFYQDMTGRGCFAGKGIYDVAAFVQATENVLDDDNILSHDLIEGILAGAGSLNDVFFYDGCPENLTDELSRLHRWTRGDWQLLPVLFSRIQICAVDRLKMLSNLLRSLYAPALLGLLIHSVWLNAPGAFAVGLFLAFHEVLVYPGMAAWRRALLELATLPSRAFSCMDAVLRTLWRLAFTKKHLMDWVPAADAGGRGRKSSIDGKIAVILLLPALLNPYWIAVALALGALFWVGADWAGDLAAASHDERESLSGEQVLLLMDIARKTWHFFETYVPLEGCGLPPDNVQMDPPAGVAMRTSPTNIGLYLMSCLSANHLGFIDREEMLKRMECTASAMEKMEKWKGQLYNWYDLQDMSPLRPRYVSAVDSGNLAGVLLLCAHALRGEPLSERMACLAGEMNLAALYDAKRELFFIGMDAETGMMSRSHYDLYASESRILSYCAMMLGQVPLKHWRHLGRPMVRCGRHRALLSWSGTMFETLMPELLLRCPPNTLAGQNRRGMVACQMDHGRAMQRPWGVSESGYYAFDLHLNYQYRAFGLKALALSPNSAQDVAAPYAAALALMVRPADAAQNLQEMCSLGWCGEMGMYEAADYQDGGRPRIVRSHMAHHQGMTLCAICNVLRDDCLSRQFMSIPRARALRLLLQEKPVKSVRLKRREELHPAQPAQSKPCTDFMRRGQREKCIVDVHLLHGSNATALVTSRGAVYAWKDGWQLNRFSGDLTNAHEGMYVHLREGEREWVIGENGKVCFDAGFVRFEQDVDGVKVRMDVCVSPEDGAVYQHLNLKNTRKEACDLEITGCMAVALAPEKDMRAHPVFQNLFVESQVQDGALMFKRRRRDVGEAYPKLVYLLAGAETDEYETSLEKLTGRTGSLSSSLPARLSQTVGNTLNPCAALRTRLHMTAGERRQLHFALCLAGEAELDAVMHRLRMRTAPERALQLSSTQARSVLGHTGIDGGMFRLLQRCSALVFDPMLRGGIMRNVLAHPPVHREALWAAGISGDLPILLVEVGDASGLDCVRDVVRMHAFYRTMGVKMDFVLIDHHGSDYIQPARGALSDLIASSHLNGSFGQPGGAFVLEKRSMNSDSYAAIVRTAALRFDAHRDAAVQLREMLEVLSLQEGRKLKSMQGTHMEHRPLDFFNGYGGFNGNDYVIELKRGILPPAPWSNVLAEGEAGAIVTERGGGFAWRGNSRHDRLTPFHNNPLREGWGWMFYLLDERDDSYVRLLPGDTPMMDFRVRHSPGMSSWSSAAGGLGFKLEMHAQNSGVRFDITIENTCSNLRHLRLAALVNWLMGTDGSDTAMLRCWSKGGACFAAGAAQDVGVFACDDPQAKNGCDLRSLFGAGDMMQPMGFDKLLVPSGGWTLHVPLVLQPGEKRTCRFLLGGAGDSASAYALARDFRSGEALRRKNTGWPDRLEKLRVSTPDNAVNRLMNGFLPAQTLNARIWGRTGLYQGGGAYGFRDQLQDMLAMIHYEPGLVRGHLLRCAARQFEAGDVLHWWHEPYSGVRTHISDDLLFLPYVAAQYVLVTGDDDILREGAPFLKDIEIPQDKEDVYAPMQPTAHISSLHRHCMLAIRRAADTGEHGLCRMGSGDWNDGMNRIGSAGRGESIWLTQFLAVCAADYAKICPVADDRAWLIALNERLCASIEEYGWDGEWYLRAYADDGRKIGSRESGSCKIDAISQAWSVLAGLDEARTRCAMDAAWRYLVDEKLGVVKLLDPSFDGRDYDPGYIAAYPQGVRENGAQYTHAACWLLCALAHQGDAARAHRVLDMLLPVNHTRTREEADVYRVEPYVMAADIYTNEEHAGRGGWSWYTGSSSWMMQAIWMLLGFERRKNRVRLHALLHTWPEVRVKLRFGLSSYELICRQGVERVTLDGSEIDGEFIEMTDDGREHTALFPPRKTRDVSSIDNEVFKCIYT